MAIAYIGFTSSENTPIFSACVRTPSCQTSEGSLLFSSHEVFEDLERCLELELIAYQSLDLIDHTLKEQSSRDGGVGQQDAFLGCLGSCLLTPCHLDGRAYAFISSTNTKLIVIVERCEVDLGEMRNLCRALYRLYCDAIANPFFTGEVETPGFINKLESLVRHYSMTITLTE